MALALAAQAEAAPTTPPSAEATALEQTPTLDGNVIGDPAWGGLTPISDFWQIQPQDG